MSKITNDGLTRSDTVTGCFIARVATVGVKGLVAILEKTHGIHTSKKTENIASDTYWFRRVINLLLTYISIYLLIYLINYLLIDITECGCRLIVTPAVSKRKEL